MSSDIPISISVKKNVSWSKIQWRTYRRELVPQNTSRNLHYQYHLNMICFTKNINYASKILDRKKAVELALKSASCASSPSCSCRKFRRTAANRFTVSNPFSNFLSTDSSRYDDCLLLLSTRYPGYADPIWRYIVRTTFGIANEDKKTNEREDNSDRSY